MQDAADIPLMWGRGFDSLPARHENEATLTGGFLIRGNMGRPTTEESERRAKEKAEKNAFKVMAGIVQKDLYRTNCPNCHHQFDAMVFKASVSNLIAASKFILEHSQGRAPARATVDPSKEKPKQIQSVVSHDDENPGRCHL